MALRNATRLNEKQGWVLANEIMKRPVMKAVHVAPLEGDGKAAEVTFENEKSWRSQVECFRLGPRGAFDRIPLLREAR